MYLSRFFLSFVMDKFLTRTTIPPDAEPLGESTGSKMYLVNEGGDGTDEQPEALAVYFVHPLYGIRAMYLSALAREAFRA